jgi:hypothetical protein
MPLTQKAVAQFNQSPSEGLCTFIGDAGTAKADDVACFLCTKGLSKAKVGEFLGKPTHATVDGSVLQAYAKPAPARQSGSRRGFGRA